MLKELENFNQLMNKYHQADYKVLEEYPYNISEQYSQYRWYGLDIVAISKIIFEDGKGTFYIVEEFSDSEKIKQSVPMHKVILALESYEILDGEIVGAFLSLEDATNYIKNNYKKINIEQSVHEIFIEKENNEINSIAGYDENTISKDNLENLQIDLNYTQIIKDENNKVSLYFINHLGDVTDCRLRQFTVID